ncbi:MAG: hypothetical protein O6848_07865 [Bacteroidetes bacterium]|nr:hypothetical protein [Bacteroidota bacterium]
MERSIVHGFDSLRLENQVEILGTKGILLIQKQVQNLHLSLYWYCGLFAELWVEDKQATAINFLHSIDGLDPYLEEINLDEVLIGN